MWSRCPESRRDACIALISQTTLSHGIHFHQGSSFWRVQDCLGIAIILQLKMTSGFIDGLATGATSATQVAAKSGHTGHLALWPEGAEQPLFVDLPAITKLSDPLAPGPVAARFQLGSHQCLDLIRPQTVQRADMIEARMIAECHFDDFINGAAVQFGHLHSFSMRM